MRRAGAPSLLALAAALCTAAAPTAFAAAPQQRMLAYMPTELIHSQHSSQQIEAVLGELDEYDIGQALFQMPRFRPTGKLRVPATTAQMLTGWSAGAASYDREHGASIGVTAVFDAVLGAKGPDLELPATRANMVAAVRSALALGVSGIQFDVEPFTETAGLVALLEEVGAMLAAEHFTGMTSLVAPAETASWSPAYLARVSALVGQLDPTFYESELASGLEYEEWVARGLGYYSRYAQPLADIVPVIPSYRSNAYHSASVENIATGSGGIERALVSGARAEGAGIWWWFGFFDDEDGRYSQAEAAADRAAWLGRTIGLAFSP